jgi:hypothetical protein
MLTPISQRPTIQKAIAPAIFRPKVVSCTVAVSIMLWMFMVQSSRMDGPPV